MTVLYTDKEAIEFLSSSSPPQKKGGQDMGNAQRKKL